MRGTDRKHLEVDEETIVSNFIKHFAKPMDFWWKIFRPPVENLVENFPPIPNKNYSYPRSVPGTTGVSKTSELTFLTDSWCLSAPAPLPVDTSGTTISVENFPREPKIFHRTKNFPPPPKYVPNVKEKIPANREWFPRMVQNSLLGAGYVEFLKYGNRWFFSRSAELMFLDISPKSVENFPIFGSKIFHGRD